jgi:hypothetical protein
VQMLPYCTVQYSTYVSGYVLPLMNVQYMYGAEISEISVSTVVLLLVGLYIPYLFSLELKLTSHWSSVCVSGNKSLEKRLTAQ